MQQRIINILFGVIIVILTGTVVYLTLGDKSTPATDITPAPVKTTTTQAPTTQNQNYLTIKEWGVQFEKPEALTDLQYEIFDNTGDTVVFITQQLINLDKSTGGKYCVTSQAPIGLLDRVRNFDSFNQFGRYIPTNVQIDNYYYYFTRPQSPCSENKQVQTLVSDQVSVLQTIILKSLKVTSDETANWKPYTNSQYGFGFQYPKKWSIDETRTNLTSVVFVDKNIEGGETREAINFSVNDKNLSIDQITNNIVKDGGYNENQIVRDYKVRIDGEKTTQITTNEFGIILYIFVHKGNIFTIENQSLFTDDVLKTFKFTK